METDLRCLIRCDVIVNSTNTSEPIIFPHHIKPKGKVLIADNSVPAGVSNDVVNLSNVISLPFASYLELPHDPDFVVSTFTPQGAVFCCAAEAMLCGLETVGFPLKGKITSEAVVQITELAEKHLLFERMGGVGSFKSAGQR
jgi:predicted amino acid dehydrogenase